MTTPETRRATTDTALEDLFRPVLQRRRQIAQATIVAVLAAALIGMAYYVRQSTRRTAFLQFRPVFEGASKGKYPNGLPFASTDIVSASIIDEVFDRNHLEQYCGRPVFHSGLAVLESSPELQFLNLEFQGRLGDSRLTAVDRDRLQREYADRRASLESRYQLIFVEPSECAPIPEPLLFKTLGDILETWAKDAQEKRGVMNLRVSVLTPAVFDQLQDTGDNLLSKADLLRTAVTRVIANIREVELLPGSEVVRGSDKNVSLPEVRAELEDLIQARLDPLVAQAGRGLGPQATQWVEQALESATIRMTAAERQAEAYRSALREYSALSLTPAAPVSSGDHQQNTNEGAALTAPIDRTFIDRIVELSSPNTAFRQEITRKTMAAMVEAVNRGEVVEQYRALLKSMSHSGGGLANTAVNASLTKITAQARAATRRFNDIFNEFSKVSLRTGPALYRVEQPPVATSIRGFGLRSFGLMMLIVLIAAPVVIGFTILVRHQLQRLVRRMS